MILLGVLLKAQPPQQILLPSFQQLVEDVEVPLTVVLVHNSGFLQEVVQDVAPNRSPLKQTRRGKCPSAQRKMFLLLGSLFKDKI